MSPSQNSSDLTARLNAGKESAFNQLFRGYQNRLCTLVARELGRRFLRREDPQDLVQSVWRSFFYGIAVKEWEIRSQAALWPLLAEICRHKIHKHIEYHRGEKRNPDREQPGKAAELPGREPGPEDAALAVDLLEQILTGLDPSYAEILRRHLEGYSETQIADALRSSRYSVHRKLARLKERLKHLVRPVGE